MRKTRTNHTQPLDVAQLFCKKRNFSVDFLVKLWYNAVRIKVPIPTEAKPMTALYNLRATDVPGTFIITKFDKLYNVESSYLMTQSDCACPQGSRPQCRHRKMLPLFRQAKHIGDGWFLDFDTRQWVGPVNDDLDAHTEAPVATEPEAGDLPPASEAPTTARSSPVAAGAPKLFVRPL